jgi:23S rRNA (uridine2552-2'-O)-methyltransferase
LAAQALTIALGILRPSGNFFVKVFEGAMLADFLKTVERHFEAVKVIKPKASRAKSSEMFLLAMNLKSAEQKLQ